MKMFERRKSEVLAILFLLCIFSIIGCTAGSGSLTPEKQLVFIYDQYNTQYTDYMITTGYSKINGIWVKTTSPELTEDQKRVLRNKKKLLTQVFPMIKTYDALIMGGGQIPPELLTEILTLLNRIALL